MEEAKRGLWRAICTDIAVWAIFKLLKYGGSPLNMKFRVTLSVLVPGVKVQNVTELLLMYRCRWLKMRTRFIVVPRERRRTGGSWAWPGWSLAENLQESLIIEEFDTRELDWMIRKMHIIHLRVQRRWQSERIWRFWSIDGIIWSCFRLWIT